MIIAALALVAGCSRPESEMVTHGEYSKCRVATDRGVNRTVYAPVVEGDLIKSRVTEDGPFASLAVVR